MTARTRLLGAAWALSLLVPGAALALAVVGAPRARVDPAIMALFAGLGASALWGVSLSTWLVLRLGAAHDAIAAAAGRVAAGDPAARVARLRAGAIDDLGRAVDAAIAAVDRLATSQHCFVTHAAHGLRSPTTALRAALAEARDNPADPDALARVWSHAAHLGAVADDLLALDRVGATLPDGPSRSLREVAVAVVESLRPEARVRGVALGVDGDGRARGRASDLQRLLRLLLENALRHSPSGAPVRVIIRDDPPYVAVRVRDQGPGVAPDARARLFVPFARTGADDEDPGHGLSLAIAREIARAHGGDLTLDPPDPARRGATFTVRLPLG
ncbi:MAG: HAMP domain-containing sensor histidine kinase [Polyangiales bacterium]